MNEKFNKNAKVEKFYHHAGDSYPPNRYRPFIIGVFKVS